MMRKNRHGSYVSRTADNPGTGVNNSRTATSTLGPTTGQTLSSTAENVVSCAGGLTVIHTADNMTNNIVPDSHEKRMTVKTSAARTKSCLFRHGRAVPKPYIRLVSRLLLLAFLLSACEPVPERNVMPSAAGSAGDGHAPAALPATEAVWSGEGHDNMKYDPPITLRTIRVNEPGVRFAPGDSFNNNPWTRAYEQRLGIRIETLWSDDSNQYNRKLDLMIASGDIPDLFRVNAAQLQQLAENGLIADLTDVYAAHVSERTRKLLDDRGPDALRLGTIGGRLMAIPWTSTLSEAAQVLHVRTDWLRKLNLPEPGSIADVMDISAAFTSRDPDGNGIHDTYGLAMDRNFNLAAGFFNGFHAYRNLWIEAGEGLAYGTVQPEMKRALAGLRELYASGQIDPDFGVKDELNVFESVVDGKIGMFYASPFAGSYPLHQAKKRDPAMEWKAYPLPSIDDTKARPQVPLDVSGYWVVSKEVKRPEAILRLLDFWIETYYENNSEQAYYEFNQSRENNPVWKTALVSLTKQYKNVDESLRIIEAMETNDRSKLTPEDKGVLQRIEAYRRNGETDGWMWDYMFSKGGSLSVAEYYRKQDLYKRERLVSLPLPVTQRRSEALGKLQSETFMKIVLGLQPVETFERFVELWETIGGREMTDEVNEWYRERGNPSTE
ncbi:extracellular solute-binding protein [Paenibacillus sp. GCM10012303]|uniref:extracellular solute-binding protein n=1 Tax=Paenibacillus sp. GCM10012303 TaxID=3317340 RepID=UPI00361FDCA8